MSIHIQKIEQLPLPVGEDESLSFQPRHCERSVAIQSGSGL